MLRSVKYSKLSAIGRKSLDILNYPLIFAIYIYRYTLSPIIGNSCRFYPTCSHYAEDALRKYGPFKGVIMSAKRLLRCHPWREGGFDPVE